MSYRRGYSAESIFIPHGTLVSKLHFCHLHWRLLEAAFDIPITLLVVITMETRLETDENITSTAKLANITQKRKTKHEKS